MCLSLFICHELYGHFEKKTYVLLKKSSHKKKQSRVTIKNVAYVKIGTLWIKTVVTLKKVADFTFRQKFSDFEI